MSWVKLMAPSRCIWMMRWKRERLASPCRSPQSFGQLPLYGEHLRNVRMNCWAAMSAKPPHRGGGWRGSPSQFFSILLSSASMRSINSIGTFWYITFKFMSFSVYTYFVTADMPHAIITISATAAAVADNIGLVPLRQGITSQPWCRRPSPGWT